MKRALIVVLLMVPALAQASNDASERQAETHEIAIRAEQFSFTPNEIEVVAGTTVRLIIEAVNVAHGLAIPDLGLSAVARPGADPTVLEFLADTPGRFQFTCSVFCGSGHGEMLGVLTIVPASGVAQREGPDRVDDLAVDLVEPDFNLVTLPTTLRLPRNSLAFRLTHRFSRPLDGGPGDGNLLEDFFGFDSAAFIGLELRYGIAPGAQVGVYRHNSRNLQIFGKYNLLWQRSDREIGLDAYVSLEGTNNLRANRSPAVGVVASKRFGERAAVYVEPMWVGNTGRQLIHPEPLFLSDEKNSFLVGLGTRIRVRETVNLVAEYVPRVSGFDNGDDHVSLAIEKRAGGHLFQVNVSNGLGGSPAQVAGGASVDDWFIGFNITRKFY